MMMVMQNIEFHHQYDHRSWSFDRKNWWATSNRFLQRKPVLLQIPKKTVIFDGQGQKNLHRSINSVFFFVIKKPEQKCWWQVVCMLQHWCSWVWSYWNLSLFVFWNRLWSFRWWFHCEFRFPRMHLWSDHRVTQSFSKKLSVYLEYFRNSSIDHCRNIVPLKNTVCQLTTCKVKPEKKKGNQK